MPAVLRGTPTRPSAPDVSHSPPTDTNNRPFPTTRGKGNLAATANSPSGKFAADTSNRPLPTTRRNVNLPATTSSPSEKFVNLKPFDKAPAPATGPRATFLTKTSSVLNASRSSIPNTFSHHSPSAYHDSATKTEDVQLTTSQPSLPSRTPTSVHHHEHNSTIPDSTNSINSGNFLFAGSPSSARKLHQTTDANAPSTSGISQTHQPSPPGTSGGLGIISVLGALSGVTEKPTNILPGVLNHSHSNSTQDSPPPSTSGGLGNIVDPVVASVVDPVVTSLVDPVVISIVDLVVTSVVDPVVASVVDPVVTSIVDSFVTSTIDLVVTSAGTQNPNPPFSSSGTPSDSGHPVQTETTFHRVGCTSSRFPPSPTPQRITSSRESNTTTAAKPLQSSVAAQTSNPATHSSQGQPPTKTQEATQSAAEAPPKGIETQHPQPPPQPPRITSHTNTGGNSGSPQKAPPQQPSSPRTISLTSVSPSRGLSTVFVATNTNTGSMPTPAFSGLTLQSETQPTKASRVILLGQTTSKAPDNLTAQTSDAGDTESSSNSTSVTTSSSDTVTNMNPTPISSTTQMMSDAPTSTNSHHAHGHDTPAHSSPTLSTKSNGMSKGEKDAIIGGGVAAGVSVITLILVLVALLVCRRKQRRQRAPYQQPLPGNMIHVPGMPGISYIPVFPVNAAPPYQQAFSPPDQKTEFQPLEFPQATPHPTIAPVYGDTTSSDGTVVQSISPEHTKPVSDHDAQSIISESHRNHHSASSSDYAESMTAPLRIKSTTSNSTGYTNVQFGVAL